MNNSLMFKLIIALTACLVTLTIKAQTCDCEGETGQRWSYVKNRTVRIGGCVGPEAVISPEAVITSSAKVCGKAIVLGEARIFGTCTVTGNSEVHSSACYGNARIDENARLYGVYVRVFEEALISGNAQLMGTTKVRGHQTVTTGHYNSGELNGVIAMGKGQSTPFEKNGD